MSEVTIAWNFLLTALCYSTAAVAIALAIYMVVWLAKIILNEIEDLIP